MSHLDPRCVYPHHPIKDTNLKGIVRRDGGQQRWYVCPVCAAEGWVSVVDEVKQF